MLYFLVGVPYNTQTVYVVAGENQTDAVLKAYKKWADFYDYEERYESEEGGNALAERLLADGFNCTETYRAEVLEHVERRLDGDQNIHIVI